MSDDDRTSLGNGHGPAGPVPFQPPAPSGGSGSDGETVRMRLRIKKLRLALLLAGVLMLGGVSALFGMLMAVAADLPALENRQEYKDARNSELLDRSGKPLGVLTQQNRVLVDEQGISSAMKHAIIAIEDRRFYENQGFDLRGMGRALLTDISSGKPVQGGSTITQQFVKNALAAQDKRTVLQKLREAALAYHLTRKWSKAKILTEYLNAIYFGNGAYGIESAARTYFGRQLGCTQRCAQKLSTVQAALIAGIVASPAAYDPVSHPRAAAARRNLVLAKLRDEGYITPQQYDEDRIVPIPTADEVQPPRVESKSPFFTTWVEQQVVDRVGAGRAFGGGLKIRTTLDLDLQNAATQVIQSKLPAGGPSAALVAIDNDTGEVLAMYGGRDFQQNGFNLATLGQRQPGSAFKPFVLSEALLQGVSPSSTWLSEQRSFKVPNSPGERFVVHNYDDKYLGPTTLANATTYSDNSVFAQVGLRVGTRKIARLAERMGIRTRVSSNYAMTLGGLSQGVTPLDMAHAYETLEQGGQRVTGSLAAPNAGPVGIRWIEQGNRKIRRNKVKRIRALNPGTAATATSILRSVISAGTGKAADIGDPLAAGKTGTTENYGDAWFVGFTKRMTVAVWVGYPDHQRPMRTEYHGRPVAGGTFPAEIWHDFLLRANAVLDARAAAKDRAKGKGATTDAPASTTPGAGQPQPTTTGATQPDAGKTKQPADAPKAGGKDGAGGTNGTQTPKQPSTPAPAPQPTPQPAPQSPPAGGGGGSGGGAAPPGQ